MMTLRNLFTFSTLNINIVQSQHFIMKTNERIANSDSFVLFEYCILVVFEFDRRRDFCRKLKAILNRIKNT